MLAVTVAVVVVAGVVVGVVVVVVVFINFCRAGTCKMAHTFFFVLPEENHCSFIIVVVKA